MNLQGCFECFPFRLLAFRCYTSVLVNRQSKRLYIASYKRDAADRIGYEVQCNIADALINNIMIELLGKTATDKLSGFKGQITGVCNYLYGENQVLISSKSTDGKKPDEIWISEDRVEISE